MLRELISSDETAVDSLVVAKLAILAAMIVFGFLQLLLAPAAYSAALFGAGAASVITAAAIGKAARAYLEQPPK